MRVYGLNELGAFRKETKLIQNACSEIPNGQFKDSHQLLMVYQEQNKLSHFAIGEI